MKKAYLLFVLILIGILSVSAQNNKMKNDPVGNWLFKAPSAREGYTTGTIKVAYTDKKYSINLTFPGNENKLAGNKVKFENDTLSFSVYIEDQDVAVKLAFIDETNMAGKAVYSEGVVPLTLSRDMKKE